MIPAVLQDRTIEASLLPHHAARLLDRSARAGSHVRSLQVLDADHAKPAHKRRGGFVVPMLAYARGFGLARGGAPISIIRQYVEQQRKKGRASSPA